VIEHRLYDIELWRDGKVVERKLLLMPPSHATIYALKGYEVFDFHDRLEMEPEYLEKSCEHNQLTLFTH